MKSDVTCLETYKKYKTTHCSKTWINVHRFLDFANTRILAKTCPALSWDQALLSLSWVNRFQARKANRKVLPFNAVLVYLNYVCMWIECNNLLLHHLHVHSRDYRDISDLKLNTRAFAARYHAYWSGEHGNLKNENRSRKISLHS